MTDPAGGADQPYQDIASLRQLASAAILDGTVDTVIEQAVSVVARNLPFSHILVGHIDEKKFAIRGALGPRGFRQGWQGKAVNGHKARLLTELASRGLVHFDAGEEECTRIEDCLGIESVQAGVSVSLLAGGRPCGMLAAYSPYRCELTEQDIGFLREVGSVLSEAFERCSLQGPVEADGYGQAMPETLWECTLNALPQLVLVLDSRGSVIRANRTLEDWGLGSMKAIRGQPVESLLLAMGWIQDEFRRERWSRTWRQVTSDHGLELEASCDNIGKFLRVRLQGIRHAEQTDASAHYSLLIFEDITEQHAAVSALETCNQGRQEKISTCSPEAGTAEGLSRCSSAELGKALEGTETAVPPYQFVVANVLAGVYLAREGRFVFCNRHLAEIFEYEVCDLIGVLVDDLIEPIDGAVGTGATDPERAGGYRLARGRTRSGRALWLKWQLVAIPGEGTSTLLGSIVDITVQRQVEDSLRRSEHMHRQLASEILKAQENERKRIASELHDGIGQSLTAAKFSLERYAKAAEPHAAPEQAGSLERVLQRIRGAIEEVRQIAMNLRPSILDDLGILATIEWFCREMQGVYSGIRIHCVFSIDEADIPSALKVVNYRIVQEALNNVTKHAGASRVTIVAEHTFRGIRISIADDGCGFAVPRRPDGGIEGPGFGLHGMSERIEASGGCFDVISRPGRGTRLEVLWPTSVLSSSGDETVLDCIGG